MGDVETWDKAEAALTEALNEFGKPWQVFMCIFFILIISVPLLCCESHLVFLSYIRPIEFPVGIWYANIFAFSFLYLYMTRLYDG